MSECISLKNICKICREEHCTCTVEKKKLSEEERLEKLKMYKRKYYYKHLDEMHNYSKRYHKCELECQQQISQLKNIQQQSHQNIQLKIDQQSKIILKIINKSIVTN